MRARPPVVRVEALGRVYVVARERHGGASVVRHDPDGRELALARSQGRLRVDWRSLSGTLLADALASPAQRGLVGDFARFIVTPPGGCHTITGDELRDWLETWRPFPSFLLAPGDAQRRTAS